MKLLPTRTRKKNEARESTTLPSPITRLQSEMDRLFDRFLSDPWSGPLDLLSQPAVWAPSMDISENEKEVTIRTEVPGVEPRDIDINVSGSVLTISGEKKEEKEEKGENFFHSERRFGSFRRMVDLPGTVDPKRISADYTNGILTVKIQKDEKAAPRKVPIRQK